MKGYFEPTGRLIMSIGKDLIKDLPAAIVELVKNSYDADANYVKITYKKNDKELQIIIEDDGHGMSQETVIGAWMVPSTNYKLKNKISPRGRVYQGRKGIGRYAVSLLGNKLQLITVKDGIETSAFFDWDEFNTEKKLSEIPIIINSSETDNRNGTKLVVYNEASNLTTDKISIDDMSKIEKELSKLLSNKDDFKIQVCYENIFDDNKKNICKNISQLEYDEIYHYRLYGTIYSNLDYKLTYYNHYTKESKLFQGDFRKRVSFEEVSCGELKLDYKVYDKDPSGIEIIMNFINGSRDTKLTKTEVKNTLIEQSGISIFRNDFRIRPYGDKGYDWLNLDSKRVQNPSMSIGSEQINGKISIESEELSGLKEKSARDGLYENANYILLQKLANLALELLEKERFVYRQKKPREKVEIIDKLFDFSKANRNVEKAVDKAYKNVKKYPEKSQEHFTALNKELTDEIKNLEKEKQSEFLEVKETIAIYQKHTTLGSVISVVLHEGRKPLAWYTNLVPKIKRSLNRMVKKNEISNDGYQKLYVDVDRLESEANRMSRLFSRLDPLSKNRRSKKKMVNLANEIRATIDIFEEIIKENNIKLDCNLDNDINMNLFEDDIYMALTNILENAVFWVNYSKHTEKMIKIRLYNENQYSIIEIIDNGPGIESEDIEKNLLFIPGYSRKQLVLDQNGTGLGLSIAGEAIHRINGKLEAIDYKEGAYFRICLRKVEN